MSIFTAQSCMGLFVCYYQGPSIEYEHWLLWLTIKIDHSACIANSGDGRSSVFLKD